jgi:hypothetical protein
MRPPKERPASDEEMMILWEAMRSRNFTIGQIIVIESMATYDVDATWRYIDFSAKNHTPVEKSCTNRASLCLVDPSAPTSTRSNKACPICIDKCVPP